MAETTLLTLALAAQDAHARLSAQVETLPEEARFLIEEAEKRLKLVVAALRDREQQLDALHDMIADRINHLLMAIQAASDLLRNGDEIREPLGNLR